jgi:hypothetical protein
MFGYTANELNGQVEILIPYLSDMATSIMKVFIKPSNRSMGANRDLFALKKWRGVSC